MLLLLTVSAWANSAVVTVRDDAGRMLAGAAVVVMIPSTVDVVTDRAVMDQKNEQFVPDFLVIRPGTEVSFPNSDQVLHHVYSFSPSKTFELPLYRGQLPSPIRFDREGIVVVGCNIHDHMIGHVWVVDAPVHALTDTSGRVQLSDLPVGTHRVLVWHPRAGRDGVREAQLVVSGSGESNLSVNLAVAKPTADRRALAWHEGY